MKLKKISNFMLGALMLITVGCVADPYNEGNYVEMKIIKGKEGVWTRKDVEQAIGSPSFVDHKNDYIVYYTGAQGYKYPVVSASIEKALTLKVEYDSKQKLKKISEIK